MQKRLINVLDIGADPSGTHDSTEAFREALANTTGQGVIVPYGTYSLSGLIRDSTLLVDDEAKEGTEEGPGDVPGATADTVGQVQRVTLRKMGGK